MRPLHSAPLAAALALVFATAAHAVTVTHSGTPATSATTATAAPSGTPSIGTQGGVSVVNSAPTIPARANAASTPSNATTTNAAATNTTTVDVRDQQTRAATIGAVAGVPVFSNPSDATFGAVAPGAVSSTTNQGFADVSMGSAVVASNAAVTEAQVNGASVDRAIRQVSRDRKRVGRNGQLLYSIAPRTNADRSHEMPDDAPPPALTGSSSTLVR